MKETPLGLPQATPCFIENYVSVAYRKSSYHSYWTLLHLIVIVNFAIKIFNSTFLQLSVRPHVAALYYFVVGESVCVYTIC